MVKILWSMLLFSCLLWANDIHYSFQTSSSTPYQNEAVLLEVNLSQEDHSKVMLFNFSPKKSDTYDFHQVSFKESDNYHDLKHFYRYVIYPKKVGKVAVAFELVKSLTDDDKVAYAISGDRDNVKGLVKKDIPVAVTPLVLNVKSVPKSTDLVGDFTLSYSLDKTTTNAYAPIQLKVELKGIGKLTSFALLEKSAKYHLFTQQPKLQNFHMVAGTKSALTWEYAISAKESFVLPKVVLNGFNPKTQKSYALLIPEHAITVNAVESKTLLDKEDTPSISKPYDWSWLGWLFSYLMVFLAGYLLPKEFWKRKKKKLETTGDEVASATTHKALLKVLLLRNDKQYNEAITLLEGVIYHNKKVSLSKIKGML